MARLCRKPGMRSTRASVALLLTALVLSSASRAGGNPAAPQPVPALTPYSANYHIEHDSLSADARRQLQALGGDRWQLSQRASVLFISLEESSTLSLTNGELRPLSYRYEQSPQKKRRQHIRFDWTKGQAVTELHDKTRRSELAPRSFDKLSYQLQLRLDLLQGRLEDGGEEQLYTVIDRGRSKQYRVSRAGEETLNTAAGPLRTVKLRQQRLGKEDERETTIWLAPDWQYLLVKLERFDEDGAYRLELKSAELGGKQLKLK